MSRCRPILLLLALLTASLVTLGGCGQKGDLYLPDRAENKN
jgi:predicted small lipoprotein YifL